MVEEGQEEEEAEKVDKQEISDKGSKVRGNHNLSEEGGEGEEGEEDAWQRSRRRRMKRGKTWMKRRRTETGVRTSAPAPAAWACGEPMTFDGAGRDWGSGGWTGRAMRKMGKEERRARSLE